LGISQWPGSERPTITRWGDVADRPEGRPALLPDDDGFEEGCEGEVFMDANSPKPGSGDPASQGPLTLRATILLVISIGLAGGYLDLVIIVFKKYFWNDLWTYGSGSDFPWSVPVGHVVLLAIPGVLLAAVNRLRPRPMSLVAGSWMFATLAIWAASLRMPLYGVATFVLALGMGRMISRGVAIHCQRPRQARSTVAGLLGLLVILAAGSTGWRTVRESRAMAGLPAPPSNARNVVLIVWDAVRAANLSLYGYPRNTTPNLMHWARKGARYNMALAPAPWTYPSHSCFFTGHWPFQLNSQWKFSLDAPVPTLAEHLASRGYQTAGFSANTFCCSYETRLDRGFIHFEDYPLTPRSLLSRTVAGSWILQNILDRDDFYEAKWTRSQSRNASGINDAFLDWLHRRQKDRPFFAFLNYFDAHEPYMPAPEYAGRFGIRPRTPRDHQFLLDYGTTGSKSFQVRDVQMARDCYDDCIAFLDDRLGRLLEKLQGRGLLDNTLVIITSDHGESFGDHGIFLHANNVFVDEVAVPLVILSPDAPAGLAVAEPVSLRDLPATVVDRLGLLAGSPFPGHSLAAYWSLAPGQAPPEITPALSEHAAPTAFQPQPEQSLRRRDVQMSLVARGRHYIRDGSGSELLYDLRRDPFDSVNLIDSVEGKQAAGVLRRMLFDVLTNNPGSIEVENAYLKSYRQWLKSLVEESPGPREPISAIEESSKKRRE
jgi:arylsulfatase A-like enzyme